MRVPILAAATGALLITSLTSQTSFISPAAAATAEGNSNGTMWASGGARRYQQIHSDITTSGAIKGMAFRTDGNTNTYTGIRTVDLELFLGLAPSYDAASLFFDQNYVPQTKLQVLQRKTLNFGPQGQNSSPGVFTNHVIPFDTPFAYPASVSLVWEVLIYSNTGSGFHYQDADRSSTALNSGTVTGTGCTATGRTAPMAQNSQCYDIGGTFAFTAGVTNGPSAAPLLLSIGATNPNVIIPGVICGGIYTDLTMSFPAGTTDANGTVANTYGFVIHFPNTIAGLSFHSQVHALDPGLSEVLKLANSDGKNYIVPNPSVTKIVKVTRMWTQTASTTDPKSVYFIGSAVGYGLTTRFDY